MAKRRYKNPLQYLKQGTTSVFLCCAVLFPVVGLLQLPQNFIGKDNRQTASLPAFKIRKIDNNSPPKLFTEPLLSLTFDDGWEPVYSVAGPLLQKYGVRTTQYIISSASKNSGYLSDKQIYALHTAGHEIGCHSVNHPDLTTLDDTKLNDELYGCQKSLSNKYGEILDFASPYGSANSRTLQFIGQVYRSQKNTNGDITNGVNETDVNLAKQFNRYNIISAAVRSDTTTDQLKLAVDYAIANNGWLVLTYHQVENSDATFSLDPASLEDQLSYLSSRDIRIVTVGQVMQSINAPKTDKAEY